MRIETILHILKKGSPVMTITNTRKTSIAKISLAGLLLAFAPTSQAIDLIPSCATVVSASKKAAYAIGFLSLVRFFTRKPDNKPARYNLDEIAAGQNITNNLWYLYDDGVIGHGKESSVLKANPENDNKLEFTESASQKGLLGNASAYAKPIVMAWAVMELIRHGGDLKAAFETYYKKLQAEGGKPVFAVIGALAAAKALSN